MIDGLWDVYNDQHMGDCAELCGKRHSISREQQDQHSITSYRRSIQATKVCITETRYKSPIIFIASIYVYTEHYMQFDE